MQDLHLSFISERERRTSDDTLRDQLTYIATRSLSSNRGRGWDFEIVTIEDEKVSRSSGGVGYNIIGKLRFYRRAEVDPVRFARQCSDITEWAGATGHNARFGKRPWVIQVNKDMQQIPINDEESESIIEADSVSLKEVGIIRPGKFFDHLYGLDAQIRVVLSAIQAAIDSSMENRFHSLLHGFPGCIAGDSFLKYTVWSKENNKIINSKGGTIENLYYRFHRIQRPGKGRSIKKQVVNTYYTVASCNDFGKIAHNRIVDVIDSGIKCVYGVETETGKFIKTTMDHEFLTPDGYTALEDLVIGDMVLTNPGVPKGNGKVLKYRSEVFVKNHAAKRLKIVNNCRYYRIKKYQAVYEASMNNMEYSDYIRFLNSCTEQEANNLWFVPFGSEIHHKDHDPTNNQLNNLELTESGSKHQLNHHLDTSKENISIYAEAEKIVSIFYVGDLQVYDLVCADPNRNFVANGFIIHNCGKTEILQSLAHLLNKEGVPFTLLDATATTEAGMRKNLLDEDATLPDVILIEEIEKAPENSLRWLLGIMDDRATIQQTNYRKTASRRVPALVLATANDYNLLSKMMYGALLSRFSNEIYCPRPDRVILSRILEREVRKLPNGRLEWIEPTLKFAFDDYKLTDPRQLRRICLSGKDDLINGTYQEDLKKTMRLETVQLPPNVEDL